MNKTELVTHIAQATGLSQDAATKALDATTGGISAALVRGESVSLVGFGAFSVADRAAKEGRNPRTGAAIQIPASKAPKFTAGKKLKEAVNS